MTKRWFLAPLLLLPGLLVTCTDANDEMIQVQRALAPSTDCKFAVTNDSMGYGIYDPKFGSDSFLMTLLVRNDLMQVDKSLVADSLRDRTNDVEIIGFEGCWAQADAKTTNASGSLTKGTVLDCNSTAEGLGKGSFPVASSEIDQAQGQAIFQVLILTKANLQAVFGTAFNPNDIPIIGAHDVDFGGDGTIDLTDHAFSFASVDPAASPRNAAWGNYPKSRTANLVVQLRAVARAQSGTVLNSGWYNFPISLCTGCVRAVCGELRLKACPGFCADGTACLTSTPACPNSTPTTCQPNLQFATGFTTDFGKACIPAQSIGLQACTAAACQ